MNSDSETGEDFLHLLDKVKDKKPPIDAEDMKKINYREKEFMD